MRERVERAERVRGGKGQGVQWEGDNGRETGRARRTMKCQWYLVCEMGPVVLLLLLRLPRPRLVHLHHSSLQPVLSPILSTWERYYNLVLLPLANQPLPKPPNPHPSPFKPINSRSNIQIKAQIRPQHILPPSRPARIRRQHSW
jgi:hypothetical protein